MNVKIPRAPRCGAVIRTYVGYGAPPLRSPIELEDRCMRRKGHSGDCEPKP